MSLTPGGRSAPIDFSLGHRACRDQASDAGMAEAIAVRPHAILQAASLQPPLAAEAAIIFRAFSFAGFCHAGRTQQNRKDDKNNCLQAFH
jgi:hypothetical protein